MTVLVSACLLGMNCKYSGGSNYSQELADYLRNKVVIAVCPEVMGGLPIPRIPSEIVNGCVVNREGISVDQEFRLGARRIMDAIAHTHIDLAILQPRSPSCGIGTIYDGTFTGMLTDGNGVFAQMLMDAGIPAMTAEQVIERQKEERDGTETV